MSWKLGEHITQYKKFFRAEPGEDTSALELEIKSHVENSKVNDSLSLMKFYSLSSGVVKHLLTSKDGNEINLPFEVTDQEHAIIRFPDSTFILGRSGTGKTTVLTMKLIQKEQQFYISSEGLSDLREDFEVIKGNVLRQIFVTVSPKLCSAIRNHICRLKRFVSDGEFSGGVDSTDMYDISESLNDFIDIPDSFIDIPPKCFPLVITFHKFLMMLDGTMMNSYFDKFQGLLKELSSDKRAGSKSLALQALIRSKEINYERFVAAYWPHFNSLLTKKLDSSTVFTQIISHIKGGLEAGAAHDGKLGREDYIKLSENRVSTLSREKRELIYDIFIEYEKKKLVNGEYDLSDLVGNIHQRLHYDGYVGDMMDFVYIDEVQDLTIRQIGLFKYICKNFCEGFVFAGDTAQTIARGIDFRFQDIKNLFYKEFLSEVRNRSKERVKEKEARVSEIFHLNQNFRTHVGVLNLAQSVVNLLYRFFPLSIDILSPESSLIYGEAPVVLESGNDENAIITIFGNSGKSAGGIMTGFGAEQVILVRDDGDKRQMFDHVGNQALVLTILECKGLEFQDVLLYNFFGASPLRNQWRIIYEYMNEQNMIACTVPKSCPNFDRAKHNVLCSELKQLYVAITRTRQRLWICECTEEYSKPMFDYWKKSGLVQVRHLDSSLAQAMRSASSPEEWRLRGIKLFNEGNFEMATMCFERAGDNYRERWARAAGLRTRAESILSSNYEMAQIELTKAAEIYENIGKAEIAANCFITLKEFEKAGLLYLEKCGTSRLEDAGDCFAMAKCWSSAADVYAKAECFSKCLSICTEGKLFDTGLHFIEQWKEASSSDEVGKFQEVYGINISFLESCALHYLECGDTKHMMKFVKAFHSLDLIRKFLKSHNFLDELVTIEVESGNYLEAAKIAKLKGNLLLEAEMLEKSRNFREASRLILFHVVLNSLWTPGSKGWPLKPFEQKEELLMKAENLAKKDSSIFYESVHAETAILSNQILSLSNLSAQFNAAQRLQNIRLEYFASRKILDIHLQSHPSKYYWEPKVVFEHKKHTSEILSQNLLSLETLLFFWDLWKGMVLKVLSYLQKPTEIDYLIYENFCLEYMGVRKEDNLNGYTVLNFEACWIRGKDGNFLQQDQNLASMDSHQFMSRAQDFWLAELLSVGFCVLEKVESLYFSTNNSLYCQGKVTLGIFELSRFLQGPKLPDLKYTSGKKLHELLASSRRKFIDVVFPLDWRKSVTESMYALRENGISKETLEELVTENLNPKNSKLTHGQIGRAVMLLFGSGRFSDDLYKKMQPCLKQMPVPWIAFFEALKAYFDSGVNQVALICMFQEALRCTFEVNWNRESDYIAPHSFMYLVECLVFLASSCQSLGGFFFTTKACVFEMLACQDWKTYLVTCFCAPDVHYQYPGLWQSIASMIESLLINTRDMREWIKNSCLNLSLYQPLLLTRLVSVTCLARLNAGWDLSSIAQLLCRNDIISNLPRPFSEKLRSAGFARPRDRNQFLSIFAEALQTVGNPLVVVSSEKSHLKFSNLKNAFVIVPETIQCREDVLQVLFPKNPEAIQKCKDHKLEPAKGNENVNVAKSTISDNNSHSDDFKSPSTSKTPLKGNPKIDKEDDQGDLHVKCRLFWKSFDDFQSEELVEAIKTGSSASYIHRIKLEVEDSMKVLDAATFYFKQNKLQGDQVADILGEMENMLDDLKKVSNALDMRDKKLEINISSIEELFAKLKNRKARLHPFLDSLFLPGDEKTHEESVVEATPAPSKESKGNNGKETNKSERKKKGRGEEDDQNTNDRTAQTAMAKSNGNKGKRNNKSKQKKKSSHKGKKK